MAALPLGPPAALPAIHPGCTCHHCEVARATHRLQAALQSAYAENQAREREAKELRTSVRALGEQVALLNQQVVGLIRQMNERGGEASEDLDLHPARDGLAMAGPREEDKCQ